MRLQGKIAVITGASSGIGRSLARALVSEGASLFLVGRDEDRLRAVSSELPEAGNPRFCVEDLSCDAGIERVRSAIESAFPRVDILINSAGTIALGDMESASMEDFDRQYAVNVRAPYALTKALLPMIMPAHGQVVFINSSAGIQPGRGGSGQYASTKHALKAIADSLRDEVNRYGIRVMSIYPGRTSTRMQEDIHRMERKDYRPNRLLQPEDISAMVLCALALPDTAEVTDLHIRPLKKSS
jgi:NADP-dependent 3-hydroxy acid dehydrogenase YdfG